MVDENPQKNPRRRKRLIERLGCNVPLAILSIQLSVATAVYGTVKFLQKDDKMHPNIMKNLGVSDEVISKTTGGKKFLLKEDIRWQIKRYIKYLTNPSQKRESADQYYHDLIPFARKRAPRPLINLHTFNAAKSLAPEGGAEPYIRGIFDEEGFTPEKAQKLIFAYRKMRIKENFQRCIKGAKQGFIKYPLMGKIMLQFIKGEQSDPVELSKCGIPYLDAPTDPWTEKDKTEEVIAALKEVLQMPPASTISHNELISWLEQAK